MSTIEAAGAPSPLAVMEADAVKEPSAEDIAVEEAEESREARTTLVEPHILAPAEDHPHWLVIYREQSHCTKGLKGRGRTFTRFWARCKRCGKEDRWGVTNPVWLSVERPQRVGVDLKEMRDIARVQMERVLQATAAAEREEEA